MGGRPTNVSGAPLSAAIIPEQKIRYLYINKNGSQRRTSLLQSRRQPLLRRAPPPSRQAAQRRMPKRSPQTPSFRVRRSSIFHPLRSRSSHSDNCPGGWWGRLSFLPGGSHRRTRPACLWKRKPQEQVRARMNRSCPIYAVVIKN